MQTLESLQRKIRSAHDLLGVVKTMKTLAAVNIRQFEAAANALDHYNNVVESGWQALFIDRRSLPGTKTSSRAVLLVLGSDQGMCGQFNESVAELALNQGTALREQKIKPLYWTAGERARNGLEETEEIGEHFSLPAGINGINDLMHLIVEQFVLRQQDQDINMLYLIYNRLAKAGGYQAVSRRILPLDREWLDERRKPWPSKCLPMSGMAFDVLFASLFREYLFASFYRAFAQSLASENAARLASMQAAEKNILEMEGNLQGKYRETRQSNITAELFDVIAGFEMLKDQAA